MITVGSPSTCTEISTTKTGIVSVSQSLEPLYWKHGVKEAIRTRMQGRTKKLDCSLMLRDKLAASAEHPPLDLLSHPIQYFSLHPFLSHIFKITLSVTDTTLTHSLQGFIIVPAYKSGPVRHNNIIVTVIWTNCA